MLQINPASRRQELPGRAASGAESPADPLLGFAGSIAGSHVLVIAPGDIELLCGLLRQGCVAATALHLAQRPEHESYDLVLVPRIVSPALVGRLIYQAKRALVPTGRFLGCIPAAAAQPEQDLGGLLIRSLRLSGFVLVQTRAVDAGLLVRADLPMNSAMPRLVRQQA